MADTTTYGAQRWVEHHRQLGHNPYPAPTSENPDRWECKCDPNAVWTAVYRVLTPDQFGQRFAHLGEEGRQHEVEAKGRAEVTDLYE